MTSFTTGFISFLFLHLIYISRDSMAKQGCPFHFSSHHVFFKIFCFCAPILQLVAFYPFRCSAAQDRWTQYEVKCIFRLVFISKLQMNIIGKNKDHEIPMFCCSLQRCSFITLSNSQHYACSMRFQDGPISTVLFLVFPVVHLYQSNL